jgi:mRNA-degrading endonuclease RelE of RelBE toxin-antitoxin system
MPQQTLDRVDKHNKMTLCKTIKRLFRRKNPFSGDIARLKAQLWIWRRRVGSHRIFYDLMPEHLLLVVLAIKRRTLTT